MLFQTVFCETILANLPILDKKKPFEAFSQTCFCTLKLLFGDVFVAKPEETGSQSSSQSLKRPASTIQHHIGREKGFPSKNKKKRKETLTHPIRLLISDFVPVVIT